MKTNGTTQYSVLYVDDEPVLRDSTKLYLEITGDLSVETAESGKEALALIENQQYDVIVSDYQMPEMDGLALLTAIRAKGDDTPYILFTGKGREEVAIHALNAGADYYLQKGGRPKVQFGELQNFIRQATGKKQAEQKAREHENRMADIIDFLPDATFAIDTKGHVIAWNRAMEKLTGILSNDILGESDYAYALPFYGRRRPLLIDMVLSEEFREGLQTNIPYPVLSSEDDKFVAELFIPDFNYGDGTHFWFTASCLYDSKGNITGAIESIRDITESKSAEKERDISLEKLRKQTKLIDTIFDVTPVDFYVYDKNMKLAYICSKNAENTGMTPEEMIGKTWSELGMPHEQLKPLEEEILGVFNTGTIQTRQTICPKSDGDRYYQYELSPIFGQNETVDLVVTTVIDITDIKQAEAALQENEKRFREIVENADDIFYRTDGKGTILMVSPSISEILGYPMHEIIGRPAAVLWFHPEERLTFLHDLKEQGKLADYELTLKHRDGTPVSVSTNSHFFTDDERSPYGVEGSVRNITSRKSVETELNLLLEQLEKQTRIIDTVFDVTPMNFYVYDKDMKFVYVCPKGAEQLGMTPEKMIGKNWRELGMPPKQFEPLQEQINRVFATGTIQSGETLYPTILGDKYYIYELTPIRDSQGSIESVLSRVMDITDTRQTENLYQTVFENTGTAMAILEDMSTVTHVNEEMEQLLGYTEREILGNQNCIQLITEQSKEKQKEWDRLRREKPGSVPDQFEFSFARKDGEIRDVVLITAKIQGTTKSILSLRDITAQKQWEETLLESEERYRTLAKNLPGIVYRVFMQEGKRMEYYNDMLPILTGYTSNELETQTINSIDSLIHPEDQPNVEVAVKTAIQQNLPFVVEYRITVKDGSIHAFEERGRPISGNDGQVLYLDGIISDITSRKKSEEALKEVNKKLNLLTSITRHDIINRISAIYIYLDIVKGQLAGTETLEDLAIIESLVDEITSEVEFTKIYDDIGSSQPKWQNCTAIFPRIQIPPGLQCHNATEGVEIYADVMLEKVFLNFLDNSIRHGDGVTEIRLSYRESKEGLTLIWEDNGRGIPATQKEQIFERGFGENTGLGLFLAREILSITRITIHETSTEGKGARFEIMVPTGGYRINHQEIQIVGKQLVV